MNSRMGWLWVACLWAAGCGDDGVGETSDGSSSSGESTTAPSSTSTPDEPTTTAPTTSTSGTDSEGVTTEPVDPTTEPVDPTTEPVDPTTETTETTDTTGTTTDTTGTTTDTTGETTTDTTGPVCPEGEEGCPCLPGDTCGPGLMCEAGTCEAPPVCGDGEVDAGEACDDANDDNTDDCLDTCALASCGDGFVQAGVEACDDANDDDTDACVGQCVAATCGDGFVHTGVEACDDGDDDDGDECKNDCTVNNACGEGKGCLVVASTIAGMVHLYEPTGLTEIANYPGLTNPQSVAPATNGKLYVGQLDGLRTVDLVTKMTANIGGGLVNGQVYGTTVRGDKVYASGSGMPHIRVLGLDGSDAGTIASPNGNNLRSTAFGPNGDLYLSSFGGGPLQRWDPALVFVGSFGGLGLATAFGVTTRANGDVLVAGQDQAAYYVFTQAGAPVKKVAVPCVGQLRNIAADGQGRLYVGCYEANKVVVFDPADAMTAQVNVSTPAGVAVLPSLVLP